MTNWVRFLTDEGAASWGRLGPQGIAAYRGELFGEPVATGQTLAVQSVRILPPCTPNKVVGLWNNFRALCVKLGKPQPEHALYFIKPGTSVIGNGELIRRPPRYRGKIAFEGELGVVIGVRCANVRVEDAERYIFGYTCVNDVTAVDLINEDPNFEQWSRAKGSDTFSCLGPCIATSLDLASARVVTTLDGVERQNYPLSDMIFSPVQLVAQISGDMTLYPGDVIACGTSVGAGSMKDGATVRVRIDGIGELHNRLVG